VSADGVHERRLEQALERDLGGAETPRQEQNGAAPGRPLLRVEGERTAPGGEGSVIRVLVADDQRVVREGLELVLGLMPGVEVVGSAGDGAEAVALAGERQPDIVLMDLRMPRVDGVEATRLLRARWPAIRVIVLTTYSDDRSVLDALRAGARGYLTKDAGSAEIRQALHQVLNDQAVVDPAVQHHLVDALVTAPAAPDGLTPREAEVLTLIAAGLTNPEIAARLVISEGTVKSHINHLLPKIDARDRAQAVAYAYRNGLAGP
jgi:DNA-binding NarL/FixJ family response regulator